jgi:hypothetical protein
MVMSDYDKILNAHYGGRDLAAAILAALRAAGKDQEPLNPDDLAAVDQLHLRGKEATLELAELAGVTSALCVIPHRGKGGSDSVG